MKKDRYYKHYIIPEFGKSKQEYLKKFKVLIVGAGGLGSSALLYLTTNGVGEIGIVDFDKVEITNLHRQVLYDHSHIGKLKTEVALKNLKEKNPEVKIKTYNLKLDKNNSDLLREYDFIIDATDNIESKLLINDLCVQFGKPFSYAGVNKFFGSTITVIPGKSACVRCIFKDIKREHKEWGVFGTVPGIIGIIQATEAMKYWTNTGKLLTDRFLFIDLFRMDFRITEVQRDRDCTCCKVGV